MKKLIDKQWILFYIRMYNNPYDRVEGLGPEDHIKFKKLMKPYSKYKKYIFTLPESDVKAILNHKYDLKKAMKKVIHEKIGGIGGDGGMIGINFALVDGVPKVPKSTIP